MLKKILFTCLTLLIVYSAVIVGYKIYEPEQVSASSADSSVPEDAISYSALKDYTLSSGTSVIHYYFFCSSDSQDCIYLENTVFKSVESSTGLKLDDILEYVDVTDLEKNMQTSLLKTDWGISEYPAFLACRVQNGEITIDNSLQWDSSQPLSEYEITQWLIKNNLYTSNATEITIETPAS